tara:strand:- start:1875 stop:2114 length:240 start_codon:yes stop_codon:yes gene_type:complete
MSDKNLSEAIKNILEKELKIVSKLIPTGVLKDLGNNISPQIENIIEQNGFIKKAKYQNLKRIIEDLEKRLSELEKIKAD